MDLYLKCISPVHIGTGKVLEPFDYVFYQEKVIVLNQDACLARIYEKHPEGIDLYSRWITETSRKIANARQDFNNARRQRNWQKRSHYNQLMSDLRRNFNLVYFCEKELQDPDLARELQTDSRYHWQTMYTISRPRGTMQLREIIQVNGEPYIPGSSLKGAIRTALAYRAIKNLDENDVQLLLNGDKKTNIFGIKKVLDKIRQLSQQAIQTINSGNVEKTNRALRELSNERKKWQRKIGDEVEKVVFGCGDATKFGIKYDDPKFDLLRLIKVSDTLDGNWEMIVGHLLSFTRDGRTGGLKAQPVQFCEFLDSQSTFRIRVEIDTGLIQEILKNSVKGWIGFQEKFMKLFAVAPDALSQELEEQVLQSLLQAIREFSEGIIKHETQWLENFSGKEVQSIQRFYDNLNDRNYYLRVGFSSGWHATTIGLALMEHPLLKEYLPELIYAFNLDLIINQEKLLRRAERNKNRVEEQLRLLNREPNVRRFPRSRRLIGENNSPQLPVGWLEVSMHPFTKTSKKKSVHPQQNQNSDSGEEIPFEEQLKRLKEKFGK